MADQQNGLYRVMHPVRVAYPNLITPRPFGPKSAPKGDPKFGATFIFDQDHPDLDPIKKLCAQIAKALLPGAALSDFSFPLTSGDKMIASATGKAQRAGKSATEIAAVEEKFSWAKGKVLVKASSKYRPLLAFVNGASIADLDDDTKINANKAKFYFGVEALPEFNFVAGVRTQDDGKDYVTAYLNGVLSLNKGERIGGGGTLAERFSGYVGNATNFDPTAGNDDDIPF